MRFAHEYTDTDNRTVSDVLNYQESRIGATARRFELMEQRIIELEELTGHMAAILDERLPDWREKHEERLEEMR